jgi:hypothetical protein
LEFLDDHGNHSIFIRAWISKREDSAAKRTAGQPVLGFGPYARKRGLKSEDCGEVIFEAAVAQRIIPLERACDIPAAYFAEDALADEIAMTV